MHGRLGLVVEQACADHELGGVFIHQHDIEVGKDRPVALGPKVENARAGLLVELIAGEVAGGDRRVIGVRGNAQIRQLPLYPGAWTRRIGEKHDEASFRAEGAGRLHRRVIRARAVMHDAPDIDQPGPVALPKLIDGADHGQGGKRERGHGSP